MQINPIRAADKIWVSSLLTKRWRDVQIITRSQVHDASILPGFIARADNIHNLPNGTIIQPGEPVGLVTYAIEAHACEIVTLDSLYDNLGIGSSLIMAVRQVAEINQCERIWLVTTNDNTHAIHFYQKRGFLLKAAYPNAIARYRLIKPSISEFGIDGIPIRDEIEFELFLK